MTKDERRPPKPNHSSMRNNGVEDCYANLAAAIIEQACADYINTPSGVFERTKRDCEQGLQTDYRFVDIPDGATVYADPPYRGTANSSRYGAFDFNAFDEWLAGVDFPVYVSEFDVPRGCVEVARVERVGTMSANTTKKYTERLFVQERFADAVQVGEPRLFGGD